MRFSIILAALSFFLVSESHARVFRNQFVEFELPPGWDCKIEGSEWVCQSGDPEVKKEVIVICAAKQRGPEDTPELYENHLRKPRPKQDLAGKPYSSEIVFVKRHEIKGQEWVDGMHLGSEIPGFYTRYIATIRGKVSMLLTWSVSKAAYDKYRAEMDQFVNSLKALDDVEGSAIPESFPKDTPFGGSNEASADQPTNLADTMKNLTQGPNRFKAIGGAVVILILVAVIIIRKRRKKS